VAASDRLQPVRVENHGKTMGNHGKTMGKPWENHGKPWENHGFYDFPLGIIGKIDKNNSIGIEYLEITRYFGNVIIN